MSTSGKGTSVYRKKDLSTQRNIALGFKNLQFAHEATLGDTVIDLTSLSAPASMTSNGFTNPTSAQIAEAKLLFYKQNLILFRSSAAGMIPYSEFVVVSSSSIKLTTPALANEIFYGMIITSPQSGVLGVDGRIVRSSGTIAAGATDINSGTPFQINAYPSAQIGEVMLIIDGKVQMRNVANATAAPAADGNYEEVPVAGGLGSILRLNNSVAYDRAFIVVSTAVIVQRPDGSRDAALESLAGQVDAIIPYLAVLAGVPESTFQSAPNDVNLKQFGDDVNALKHWTVLAKSTNYAMTTEDDVIIASAGAQITLPDPVNRRRPVHIKRNSASNIIVKRYGSENIDGSASDDTISFNLETKTYVSDGTNWWLI